jgi:hypothetical protein
MLELGSQGLGQTTLLRFKQGARVVRHEGGNPRRPAMLDQPTGTIERMQACIHDIRGVPDVVQPRRGDKYRAVDLVEGGGGHLSLGGDSLHMPPPPGQPGGEKLLGCLRRILNAKVHCLSVRVARQHLPTAV